MQNSIIECNACHAKFKLDPEALPKDPKDLTKYFVRCAECQEKIFLESLAQPELVNVSCPECHSNYAIERSKFIRPVLKARCYVCNTVFDASVHGSFPDGLAAEPRNDKAEAKPPARPPSEPAAEPAAEPATQNGAKAAAPSTAKAPNTRLDQPTTSSPSFDSSADPFAFLKDTPSDQAFDPSIEHEVAEAEPNKAKAAEQEKAAQEKTVPEKAIYEQLLNPLGPEEHKAPDRDLLAEDFGIEVASVDETRRLGKSADRTNKKQAEKLGLKPKADELSWRKESRLETTEPAESSQQKEAFSDSDAFQIGVKVDNWSHSDEELYDLSYKELDKERQKTEKKPPSFQNPVSEPHGKTAGSFSSAQIFKEEPAKNSFPIDPEADDAYQAAIKLNNQSLSSLNFLGAIPADQKYKIFKQQKDAPDSFSYQLPPAFKQKLSLVQFFGMNFFSPEKKSFWSVTRRFFERYYWLIIPTGITIATILTFFFWN